MTDKTKARMDALKAQRQMLSQLTAGVMGSKPRRGNGNARLSVWVDALKSGVLVSTPRNPDGDRREKKLSVSDTVQLVLKVLRVDPAAVPVEVRTRFDWRRADRNLLVDIASGAGVAPVALATALGLGLPEAVPSEAPEAPEAAPSEAPEAPEAVPSEAPEAPEAAPSEAPEAPARRQRRTGRR